MQSNQLTLLPSCSPTCRTVRLIARMSQHRAPIKRISQGSLRALSRSASYPDAPHGLGFLTPALAELTEEMQTLQSHTQGLRNLENSLTRFNESFASWLYVQNMASLTLDWTQVLSFFN